jgi:hypothetical protein
MARTDLFTIIVPAKVGISLSLKMCQRAELATNYHFNKNAVITFADYHAEQSFARFPSYRVKSFTRLLLIAAPVGLH